MQNAKLINFCSINIRKYRCMYAIFSKVFVFEVFVFEVLGFEVFVFEVLAFEVSVFEVLAFEVLGLRFLGLSFPNTRSTTWAAIFEIPFVSNNPLIYGITGAAIACEVDELLLGLLADKASLCSRVTKLANRLL